ncbi:angiopoietin-1 isoform X2 [Anabas testudineus]|uniref:Fibrinogen C-terminal domain-containing protein n=1 Tax=Anabas testudineus TaxID=64144 RepID=A0A3Q1HNH0_ANATE|nr:angiopoietin-1 isoform X2 [Anabas testudineus]XP_026204548.1 angiopoietin-1 isoform X2 [Anabas testudineus]
MMLCYNFGRHLLSLAALLVIVSCGGGEQRKGTDSSSSTGGSSSSSSSGGSSSSNNSNRRFHKIQHGQCTYTFILPEGEGAGGGSCREAKASSPQHNANSLQRDAPPPEPDFPSQKIQQLEHIMENYTQWLQKIENYIKESMKTEMAQLQQSAVHNHTAAMLEMGTNLLSQTAEQTRKLTDVETQVLNQTSRLEIQLLENSLSTNKLEKQLMIQTNEISKLHDKNSLLEQKMLEMEMRHREELETLRQEKGSLQALVGSQSGVIRELEAQLSRATGNSTVLQRQQQEMMDTVHNLLNLCSKDGVVPNSTKDMDEDKKFSDCADLYQAGFHKNGAYNIQINSQETKKVYCNMETTGGGWTVIQRREDGSVDFQRTWKEYKMGFGSVSAEHWLGNEYVYQLTSQRPYALRVELTDWDGHQAFSLYDRFQIASEKQNYRLSLKSHSGTAGRQSSLVIHGADFSTKDMDNDNCLCKCALMLTGGWWFDACGPSNLNGMYFTQGQHIGKLNGIKWHYFKGPSYSLRATAMMIRPLDFS